ncbi:MAG TPA: formate dehydrogenase subunit gamma [Gammaproteobacteria bacterium]|nr:formate dehydrogenase subunit gamma [Gammaproteobacteria bacterium]
MPDATFPPSSAFPPWNEIDARALLAPLVGTPGATLPALHALQDRYGYVPPAAIAVIADVFNLSRAEVHGVISFYDWFRDTPPGRHTLRICRAEACQAMGANALVAHARERLGVDFHATTADGALSLEPVFCLGNCACAPSVMLDGQLHGRMSPARLDALLAAETGT